MTGVTLCFDSGFRINARPFPENAKGCKPMSSVLFHAINPSPFLFLGLRHTLRHKVEERELTRSTSILIYKPACQITAKDGPEIVLRYSFHDLVQADLLQEQLRQGIFEDGLPQLNILPQLCLLQLLVQLRDCDTEGVT